MPGLKLIRSSIPAIPVLLTVFVSAMATAQISAQPTTNLPSQFPTETNRPVTISGSVVLEDGTALAEPVEIQRVCGNIVRGEVTSDSSGKFTILLDGERSLSPFQSASEGGGATEMGADMGGARNSQTTRTQLWNCDIRAQLPGYMAGVVSLAGRDFSMPVNLKPIVMRRVGGAIGNSLSATAMKAPASARKEYDKGRDEFAKKKYEDADKHLAKAIELYPQYASALDLRGREQRARKMDSEAEKSFTAAIAADDKYVPPYLHLAATNAVQGKWDDVVRLSDKAIALDPNSYAEPYYFKTVALLKLNQAAEAKKAVLRVIEVDKEHRFPRAELILGNMLRAEGDIAGSAEHLRTYTKYAPPGPELSSIQEYLASLDKQGSEPKSAPKSN